MKNWHTALLVGISLICFSAMVLISNHRQHWYLTFQVHDSGSIVGYTSMTVRCKDMTVDEINSAAELAQKQWPKSATAQLINSVKLDK